MVLHKKLPPIYANVERTQPSLYPRATQQSSSPAWSMSRDPAGSSVQPLPQRLCPPYPPSPFPEPLWASSTTPMLASPLGVPLPGLGFGNHHDRVSYQSQFPPLTSDGYQS